MNNKILNEVYIIESDSFPAIGPNKFIKIELISKSDFVKMRTASNEYLTDTNLFVKSNGSLKIETKGRNYSFKDNPDGVDDYELHTFLGQYKDINKLLVATDIWEDGYHYLIDKTTGKSSTFFDFPFLSSNKKTLITCGTDYDYWRADEVETPFADIQVYNSVNDTTVGLYGGQFKNWLPTSSKTDLFWGNDKCFYAAIQPMELLGTNNYRYIKLRLKSISDNF